MHTLTRTALAAGLITSVAFTSACGGSGDDESSGMITVDEGGSIEIEGTDTSIDIPANALGEDTEITISLAELGDFAALESGRNAVLVIAPDGLVLSAPATITIDPGAPAVTGDQLLSIRQFRSGVDGGWVSPELSTAELHSGGLVTASIIQFAPTALVVKDPLVASGTIAGTVLHIYTEAPLSGITFELEQDGSVIATAVSDNDGKFGFAEVAVGTYNVHADVSADENCYSDPVDKDAVVTDQNTTNVFFGFVPGPC